MHVNTATYALLQEVKEEGEPALHWITAREGGVGGEKVEGRASSE